MDVATLPQRPGQKVNVETIPQLLSQALETHHKKDAFLIKRDGAWTPISMETVIRLAPDVVVDAADMGETSESRRRKQPETEAMWRREGAVAAVRANAIHVVTSDAFLVPGPRVVEAAETLAAWLHGIQGR